MDIARASYSCLRCRRQKKKCDRALPRCSHCVRVNAACGREAFVGGSPVTVRSVSELESEVARLETQITAGVGSASPSPAALHNSYERAHYSPAARNAIEEPFQVTSGIQTSLEHALEAQTPSLSVLADLNTATIYDNESYNLIRMLNNALGLENSTLNLRSSTRRPKPKVLSRLSCDGSHDSPMINLSKEVQSFYLERYFEYVNPTYPVLSSGVMHTELQSFQNGRHIDPSKLCQLHLALAIGAIYPSSDTIIDASTACRLWAAALTESAFSDESEDTVRILILVTLFSLFEDGCGNSWHLVELVIRSCVKLGLHSKSNEQSSNTESSELFWSGYLLDRWISCMLGLPTSIQNEEIQQPLPNISLDSNNLGSPVLLWHMAYHVTQSTDRTQTPFLRHLLFEGTTSGKEPSEFSFLLPSLILSDMRLAHLSLCLLHGDCDAVDQVNNIAVGSLSMIESNLQRSLTLLWTTGYATFISVIIRLMLLGQSPKKSLLVRQNVLDTNFITRAIDVLSVLERRFVSLECLKKILGRLSNQAETEPVQRDHETAVQIPLHSTISDITLYAFQLVGIT